MREGLPYILRGWKAIEDYLGMDRKTILSMGFPLCKARGRRGHVYAMRAELDMHLMARDGRGKAPEARVKHE